MTTDDIRFAGGTLSFGSRRVSLQYPIEAAFPLGSLVIVLYDPDSMPGDTGQFANLIALDRVTGKRRWIAELPTSYTGDRYYKVISLQPLKAYSVKSFACTIDPETGRIIDKAFYS